MHAYFVFFLIVNLQIVCQVRFFTSNGAHLHLSGILVAAAEDDGMGMYGEVDMSDEEDEGEDDED